MENTINKLDIQLREEGTTIPQGASVSNVYIKPNGRLHVYFREGNRIIEFAIPVTDPLKNLDYWLVRDDTI